MGFLKKLYSRLFPASKQQLKKGLSEIMDSQKDMLNELNEQQELLNKKIEEVTRTNQVLHAKLLQDAEVKYKKLGESLQMVRKEQRLNIGVSKESVWADIFHDTINEESWLIRRSFSPGRWAIGYPVLYVMYRVLNEIRPVNILELGLGQSTNMISQYVAAKDGCQHIVVENDEKWIKFFKNNHELTEKTKILQKDWVLESFEEVEVRQYENFADGTKGKFDFIFIDAPLGGDMSEYSRVDVARIMPECLAEDFVIMVDDYNRSGERNTVEYMRKVLRDNNIDFKEGRYSGEKDVILICSPTNSFLTSM